MNCCEVCKAVVISWLKVIYCVCSGLAADVADAFVST